MKKLILILLLPLFGVGQITGVESNTGKTFKIGEIKPMGVYKASLEFKASDKDTVYFFAFQNCKYPSITDIKVVSFEGKNTLDDLYKLMKSAFSDENKKNKDFSLSFKLGREEVRITNSRQVGTTILTLWADQGYCDLMEKQVDKLFAKK